MKKSEILLGQASVQMLFKGYYFDHSINNGGNTGGKLIKDFGSGGLEITADTMNNKAK